MVCIQRFGRHFQYAIFFIYLIERRPTIVEFVRLRGCGNGCSSANNGRCRFPIECGCMDRDNGSGQVYDSDIVTAKSGICYRCYLVRDRQLSNTVVRESSRPDHFQRGRQGERSDFTLVERICTDFLDACGQGNGS